MFDNNTNLTVDGEYTYSEYKDAVRKAVDGKWDHIVSFSYTFGKESLSIKRGQPVSDVQRRITLEELLEIFK